MSLGKKLNEKKSCLHTDTKTGNANSCDHTLFKNTTNGKVNSLYQFSNGIMGITHTQSVMFKCITYQLGGHNIRWNNHVHTIINLVISVTVKRICYQRICYFLSNGYQAPVDETIIFCRSFYTSWLLIVLESYHIWSSSECKSSK